jgi:hypothetical protein
VRAYSCKTIGGFKFEFSKTVKLIFNIFLFLKIVSHVANVQSLGWEDFYPFVHLASHDALLAA